MEPRRCFECGERASHNHHVVPRSMGGTKTVPLCLACHSLVHRTDFRPSALARAKALREGIPIGRPPGARPRPPRPAASGPRGIPSGRSPPAGAGPEHNSEVIGMTKRTNTSVPIADFSAAILKLYEPRGARPGPTGPCAVPWRSCAQTRLDTTDDMTSVIIDPYVRSSGYTNSSSISSMKNFLRVICSQGVRLGYLRSDPFEGRPWGLTEQTYRSPHTISRRRGHSIRSARAGLGDLGGTSALCPGRRHRPGRRQRREGRRVEVRDLDAGTGRLKGQPSRRSCPALAVWRDRCQGQWLFPRYPGGMPLPTRGNRSFAAWGALNQAAEAAGIDGLTCRGLRNFWKDHARAEVPAPIARILDRKPRDGKLPPPLVLPPKADGPPLVLGKVKPRLSGAGHRVSAALLEAGTRGLSKSELQSASGDARGILRRLMDLDPDWAKIIHFPGRRGGGRYRIGPPADS